MLQNKRNHVKSCSLIYGQYFFFKVEVAMVIGYLDCYSHFWNVGHELFAFLECKP